MEFSYHQQDTPIRYVCQQLSEKETMKSMVCLLLIVTHKSSPSARTQFELL